MGFKLKCLTVVYLLFMTIFPVNAEIVILSIQDDTIKTINLIGFTLLIVAILLFFCIICGIIGAFNEAYHNK